MNNKNLIWLVVIILVGGVLVWWFMSRQPVTAPATTDTTPDDTERTETVVLSEQNDSGITGTVVLREVAGYVQVSVTLEGFTPGVNNPNHIHLGSCDDLGAIQHSLPDAVNGVSEITFPDVTFAQLESELPLAINVHKSNEESSVYVACGDLVL